MRMGKKEMASILVNMDKKRGEPMMSSRCDKKPPRPQACICGRALTAFCPHITVVHAVSCVTCSLEKKHK